jgi:hypothetical protein
MRGDGAFRAIQAARRTLAENTVEDWKWLERALEDPERKWFVADVFSEAPIPKRLLHAFVRAAVYEPDASRNQYFVKPCLRAYGGNRILNAVLRYLEHGTKQEKVGAAKAIYWCGEYEGTTEQRDAFRSRLRCAIEAAGLPWQR